MRTSHIYLAAVALATLGVVVAAPVLAEQQAPPASSAPIDRIDPAKPSAPGLSADRRAEYDGWSPDRKYAYDAWPAETQVYYWTLKPPQRSLFWQLSDEDRIAITAMTGTEREAAWKMIEKRASGSGKAAGQMPEPDES